MSRIFQKQNGKLVEITPAGGSCDCVAQLGNPDSELSKALGNSLDAKLPAAVESGLDEKLPSALDSRLPALVDTSISGLVDEKLDAAVSEKLPAVVENSLADSQSLANIIDSRVNDIISGKLENGEISGNVPVGPDGAITCDAPIIQSPDGGSTVHAQGVTIRVGSFSATVAEETHQSTDWLITADSARKEPVIAAGQSADLLEHTFADVKWEAGYDPQKQKHRRNGHGNMAESSGPAGGEARAIA